ncbi:MAG: nuclear transport factor 2 family protein [Hyphomicrobiales bacterium]|nr:nuclear transport factor 2 family protein [Hyphomicrobiales bacterium]
MTKPSADDTADLAVLLDEHAIFRLIRSERFARDQGDWSGLAEHFVEDSYVRVTWFTGTGAEFAELSRMMADKGRHSKHPIWPVRARVVGDRGLVESYSEILNRSVIDGVEVDMTQYCRFFSQVVRTPAGWKMKSFEAIYQKDCIMPVNPAEKVPIDWDEVRKYRDSYRIWAWAMIKRGYVVPDDLLGDDRPDMVTAFYAEMEKWLHRA